MYHHCLVCGADLGSNDEVESFSRASRIAYDPARGRLWAICPVCERWNLSPLESRWEALDELERLWEGVAVRVSTDRMALARTLGGAWIVRVGTDPRDDEFAFWRWGRQGGRRRALWPRIRALPEKLPRLGPGGGLALAVGGGALATATALVPWVAVPVLSYVGVAVFAGVARADLRPDHLLRLDREGRPDVLTRATLLHAGLSPRDDELGWSIQIQRFVHPDGSLPPPGRPPGRPDLVQRWVEYTGEEAVAIGRRLLPLLNRRRARDETVREALTLIGETGSIRRLIPRLAAGKPRWMSLPQYPEPLRLAMEIALFQERERAAMDGELARLAAEWREAEELAAISDELIPPRGWEAFVARHRPGD